MGCAASNEAASKSQGKKKKGTSKTVGDKESSPGDAAANPLASAATRASSLVGKDKYIAEPGAVGMTVEDSRGALGGIFLVFVGLSGDGICFVYRDATTGTIFVKDVATDEQLEADKQASGVDLAWAPFFKSIASETLKQKAKLTVTYSSVTVTFVISSSKDPKNMKPFTVKLLALVTPPHKKDSHQYFIEPMTRMAQRKRTQSAEALERERRLAQLECKLHLTNARIDANLATANRVAPITARLREQINTQLKVSTDLRQQITVVERKVKQRRRQVSSAPGVRHPLDALYEGGGPVYFEHLSAGDDHIPVLRLQSGALAESLKSVFPGASQTLASMPTDPALAALYQQFPGDKAAVQNMLTVLGKLDSWDLNVFDLEKATGNNALFYVTYAILYKLDLVRQLDLDDAVLRTFLAGVQAGYHPNAYHNATHAADVAHINYFIMVKCGLVEKLNLSPEELMAAVLAGAIHDYDHPGFNNSFHTRTNAYLSTLYNDKSILENHHLACIFEMMRTPKYNIFAKLTADQKRDARDTMVEMVLSTDMGNHSKIFQAFRRRQTEGTADWQQKKEDVRLALSMSIKMADISNTGRPNHLYVEWAKNIAAEFYKQGDAELSANLAISPFMDRRKHRTDFPKGQQSFMSYIVIPMFEAMVELLPTLEPALTHCNENREFWRRKEASGDSL